MWNEEEIVQGCLAQKPDAQRVLYEKLAPKMLGVCFRYCNDRDDAQDVMHEAFVKVFLNLQKFKFNSSLETWITRIMINTSIDFFKKRAKTGKLFENMGDKEDMDEAAEIDDPGPQVSEQALLDVIAELPQGQQMIFNLYAIEGYTHKDIAASLGISEGTSKSQLAFARQKLKKVLKERKIIE